MLLAEKDWTKLKMFGVFVTLSGAIWYSYEKEKIRMRNQKNNNNNRNKNRGIDNINSNEKQKLLSNGVDSANASVVIDSQSQASGKSVKRPTGKRQSM